MPRKKKLVPLRRHYSPDLKKRVIYQAYTLGKSPTQTAIDLDMPLRVVQRVKQTWSEVGEVCRERRYLGRSPLLSPARSKVRIPEIYPVQLVLSYPSTVFARTH